MLPWNNEINFVHRITEYIIQIAELLINMASYSSIKFMLLYGNIIRDATLEWYVYINICKTKEFTCTAF